MRCFPGWDSGMSALLGRMPIPATKSKVVEGSILPPLECEGCAIERTRSREGRGLWGVRFVGSVGEALIDQG
jgi:hypothetical protein